MCTGKNQMWKRSLGENFGKKWLVGKNVASRKMSTNEKLPECNRSKKISNPKSEVCACGQLWGKYGEKMEFNHRKSSGMVDNNHVMHHDKGYFIHTWVTILT